jgi:hypothetical protein
MQNHLTNIQAMIENENICIKAIGCPLFQGEMLVSMKAQEIYMGLYCNNGEKGQHRCRRLQTVRAGYKPDDKVMPNDERSVEQIISDNHIKI